MRSEIPMSLRVALVCAVLLVLLGFAELLLAPVVASAVVERIVEANTSDTNEWHMLTFSVLTNFTNFASGLTMSLSLAITVLVSIGARSIARIRKSGGFEEGGSA